MRRATRLLQLLLAFSVAVQVPDLAAADAPDARLEQAKELFREGVSLLNAGDPQRALESFLRSREILPSGKNTANAAICLERLGRYDEALELYEQLLSRFSADLDSQDRANLVPTMAALRDRLASLDISANVDGSLIVDGKPRGNLPRSTPLRVLPGRRRIRILKEGFRTFEKTLELGAGQVEALDAELEPLAGLGAIRVEDAAKSAGELLIDGKVLGRVPWEGTLPTGTHLMQVVGERRGSVPLTIHVVERRTLYLHITTRALGAAIRISAFPRSATLYLGKQPLGRGEWVGRLPVGQYSSSASEPGYFDATATIVSSAAPQGAAFVLNLRRDPEHKRWPQPRAWFPSAGVAAGVLYAPTLNGGHEATCPSLCAHGNDALGGNFEAEVAIEHQSHFGAKLAAGYAFAGQDFSRAIVRPYRDVDVTYALHQELVMGGPYARLAAFKALPLPLRLRLRSELGIGLLAATYEAAIGGAAWTTNGFVPAAAVGLTSLTELAPFVTTSLGIERKFGDFTVWFVAGAWFVTGSGPTFSQAELAVEPDCPVNASLEAVGCVPNSKAIAGEAVHGPFAFVAPALGGAYRF